jgi:CDP-6-deoxy-D-xylo-4-hexulose-3-dehydrase
MFWPLQENVIFERDINELTNYIRTTKRFTQFEKVRQFEENFSAWEGIQFSVYVNSGSSANLILINALKEIHGWSADSEIIVPSVTWSTNVSPVIQNGMTPVFVDVNLEDLSFNYEKIDDVINKHTVAIFVTHLMGFPANMDLLQAIARKYNLIILEDCCEAQGATYKNIKVGNFGVAGTFSFYWGHHMTTVEGGIISTNNERLYEMLLLKRSHGLARELPKEKHQHYAEQYPHIDFNFLFLTDGFNVRNTEFNATIGISQLKAIDSFIDIRRKNYDRFIQILKKYPEHFIPIKQPGMSPLCLPFLMNNLKEKQQLQQYLRDNGIETRPIISGNLLLQPFLHKYYNKSEFQNSDFVHTNGFYIGNNQFVNEERMNILSQHIDNFFEDYGVRRG